MAKDKASGDDMSQRDKDANGFTIASEMTTGGQSRDMSEGGRWKSATARMSIRPAPTKVK